MYKEKAMELYDFRTVQIEGVSYKDCPWCSHELTDAVQRCHEPNCEYVLQEEISHVRMLLSGKRESIMEPEYQSTRTLI